MGRGEQSVAFHKQHKQTNYARQETIHQLKRECQRLSNCQMWTTYAQTHSLLKVSLSCTLLKDNEAVIKMIIKGRSPTIRHVSGTHRVALDLSFDRINLDPKIQIKYVDTKDQLADMLIRWSFTRDEWNY